MKLSSILVILLVASGATASAAALLSKPAQVAPKALDTILKFDANMSSMMTMQRPI